MSLASIFRSNPFNILLDFKEVLVKFPLLKTIETIKFLFRIKVSCPKN